MANSGFIRRSYSLNAQCALSLCAQISYTQKARQVLHNDSCTQHQSTINNRGCRLLVAGLRAYHPGVCAVRAMSSEEREKSDGEKSTHSTFLVLDSAVLSDWLRDQAPPGPWDFFRLYRRLGCCGRLCRLWPDYGLPASARKQYQLYMHIWS